MIPLYILIIMGLGSATPVTREQQRAETGLTTNLNAAVVLPEPTKLRPEQDRLKKSGEARESTETEGKTLLSRRRLNLNAGRLSGSQPLAQTSPSATSVQLPFRMIDGATVADIWARTLDQLFHAPIEPPKLFIEKDL